MGVLSKSRRQSILLGNDGNALVILIAINLIVFVIINFIKIAYYLGGLPLENYFNKFLVYIMVPGKAALLAARPWTIFTYMFAHDGVWSLISTLLWLWGFGFILQSLIGNKHLTPIYLYGGVAGVLAFSLAVNAIPVLSQNADGYMLEGGKAAVMAIALAATTMAPNFRIFPMLNGGIPLWVLTMIFIIIDFATIASAGAGTALAHLAGALIGFLYISQLKAGNDLGQWMHSVSAWVSSLFEPSPEIKRRDTIKKEIFYQSSASPAKPFVKKTNVTQQRVDELLDKINQRGYQTLSEEEKEYLRQASKEDI